MRGTHSLWLIAALLISGLAQAAGSPGLQLKVFPQFSLSFAQRIAAWFPQPEAAK
jgi:hypothetical protein